MGVCFASAAQSDLNLHETAEVFIDIAEASKETNRLWGRLGGTPAERDAARALERLLESYADDASVEPFQFEVYRPESWRVFVEGEKALASAIPVPADSRSAITQGVFDVVHMKTEDDWRRVSGKLAFVEATAIGYSPARNSVRTDNVYERAVRGGARGLVFSLPTPPGRWLVVPPVDKPFAKPDANYPDGIRPIPAFCVSSDDGARLRKAVADGERVGFELAYKNQRRWDALNTVATLEGGGEQTVLLFAHLDSYFSGANDDASGLAVLVGLARALSALPIGKRPADFVFAGVSAHHDSAAGMRALMQSRPETMNNLDAAILLEHLDAQPGANPDSRWPLPLNDARAAYVGPKGWPELEAASRRLAPQLGLMQRPPRVQRACIADLFVICGEAHTYCLIQSPPYYHSNHDTRDKLSEEGLQAALEFHLRLLETIGAIAP